MIIPGYEDAIEEDRRLINAGQADRDGNTFHINGRTYVEKGGTGTFYPIGGEGTITVDRDTHRCLSIFARYNGPTDAAFHEINRDPRINDEQRDTALDLWNLRAT